MAVSFLTYKKDDQRTFLGGLWKFELLKRQLGNPRRIANAGLPDLDNLLGDDQGLRIRSICEAKFVQGLLIRSDQTLNVFWTKCRILDQPVDRHAPALAT